MFLRRTSKMTEGKKEDRDEIRAAVSPKLSTPLYKNRMIGAGDEGIDPYGSMDAYNSTLSNFSSVQVSELMQGNFRDPRILYDETGGIQPWVSSLLERTRKSIFDILNNIEEDSSKGDVSKRVELAILSAFEQVLSYEEEVHDETEEVLASNVSEKDMVRFSSSVRELEYELAEMSEDQVADNKKKTQRIVGSSLKVNPEDILSEDFDHLMARHLRSVKNDAIFRKKLKRHMSLTTRSSKMNAYNINEVNLLESGKKLEGLFDYSKAMISEKRNLRLSAIKSASSLMNWKSNVVFGRVEGVIAASVEDVAAELFNFGSTTRRQQVLFDNNFERQTVMKRFNVHHVMVHTVAKMNYGGVDIRRGFVNHYIWKRISATSITVIAVPYTGKVKSSQAYVKGELTRVFTLTQITTSRTQFTYSFMSNMRGDIPEAITYLVVPRANMSAAVRLVSYFSGIVDREEMRKEDGVTLGELIELRMAFLVKQYGWKHRHQAKQYAIELIFIENESLRSMASRHKFFKPMVQQIFRNVPKNVLAPTNPLESLTAADGVRIGHHVALNLVTNSFVNQALHMVISETPALQTLCRDEAWLESFLVRIAQSAFNQSKFGLILRVTIGLVLSITDVVTDIVVTATYFAEGNLFFGRAMLTMISSCMLLQLVNVYFQQRNNPLGRMPMLLDILSLLIGVKPAIDAYRVAIGVEMKAHNIYDPVIEYHLMRMIEIFAESLPGCVLQMYALVTTTGNVEVALCAIASSIFTAGFSCALLTYDRDTDPRSRKMNPSYEND